jgi:hypothetical protein
VCRPLRGGLRLGARAVARIHCDSVAQRRLAIGGGRRGDVLPRSACGYPALAMDLFLAGCQGLGLALAAGMFAGASGRRDAIGTVLLVAAVVGGAALFAASLTQEDHPAWPGLVAGALFAWLAVTVTRDVAAGAATRAESGDATGVIIAFSALVLAGLSLVVSPISLLVLGSLAWLAFARQRRADRKYEGLRSLR